MNSGIILALLAVCCVTSSTALCYNCYSVRYTINNPDLQRFYDQDADDLVDRRCEQDAAGLKQNPPPTCSMTGKCLHLHATFTARSYGVTIKTEVLMRQCAGETYLEGCREDDSLKKEWEQALQGLEVTNVHSKTCYCEGDFCNSGTPMAMNICRVFIVAFLSFIIIQH